MIAEKYYGSGYNWVDIAKENQLVSPNLITIGQVLIIPKAAPIIVSGATKTPVNQVILGSEYTVVKGDSLWKIAVRAYGDGYRWPEIWQANKDKIANPGLIEIDTVLTLPR
jgi:nucleoid-associated protein YgaU